MHAGANTYLESKKETNKPCTYMHMEMIMYVYMYTNIYVYIIAIQVYIVFSLYTHYAESWDCKDRLEAQATASSDESKACGLRLLLRALLAPVRATAKGSQRVDHAHRQSLS